MNPSRDIFFGLKTTKSLCRVRQDIRGGAWCPRSVIQAGVEEWLQVNLHKQFWISGVETQGRFGGGQGQEFTEHYQIQYWRQEIGRRWERAVG